MIGWMKSCGFSGHLNLREATHVLSNDPLARWGYFGKYHAEYGHTILIEPTKGGKGGTGKAHYDNRKGNPGKFQVGNYLRRTVVSCDDKEVKHNLFISHLHDHLNVLGDFVHFPADRKTSATNHVALQSVSGCHYGNTAVAVNHNFNGSCTPWCIHYDRLVYGASAMAAEPEGGVRLHSADVNPGADAGEFFHEVGGLVHGVGRHDIVIFNGCHYHSPLMPFPSKSQQPPATKSKKKVQAGRYSYVVFRDSA